MDEVLKADILEAELMAITRLLNSIVLHRERACSLGSQT